jgi:hypothetical protein
VLKEQLNAGHSTQISLRNGRATRGGAGGGWSRLEGWVDSRLLQATTDRVESNYPDLRLFQAGQIHCEAKMVRVLGSSIPE